MHMIASLISETSKKWNNAQEGEAMGKTPSCGRNRGVPQSLEFCSSSA